MIALRTVGLVRHTARLQLTKLFRDSYRVSDRRCHNTSPWYAQFADVTNAMNDGSATIVDVRNPDELKTDGKIPKAVNLPLSEVAGALQMPEAAFQSQYGFARPGDHDPLILHCKGGVRATKAAGLFTEAGFSNLRVYKGSFGDWVEQGGPVEK